MYQELLTKYHDLVKELASLKREGFIPQPAEPAASTPASLPVEVSEAIQEMVEAAGWDTDLERTLIATAWAQLRHNVNERDVADAIRTGEPLDV